ncbi:MAG: outer membrane protein, partial [Methylocella sp.]
RGIGKMKKLLAAATALSGFLALAGAASAADPVIEDTVYDWSGFYIGINGGYAFQDSDEANLFTDDITPVPVANLGDATDESRGDIGKLSAEGEFGGLQAGLNWQSGMLVLGGEADIQLGDIDGKRSGAFSNPSGSFPIDGEATLDLDWFSTVRGRIGASFDRVLIYATGGVAFGEVDYDLDATEVGGGLLYQTRLNSSKTEVGFVAGGGVEFAINQNWTVKAEYQYMDLGKVKAKGDVTFIAGGAPTGETARTDINAVFQSVRLGINFKF